MGQVCAVAAQPGHMKELQLIQLEHGLRIIDSPGVIFDDDEGIQGQIESSVLLRNVVKPEDVDNPISVGEWVLPSIRLQRSPKFLSKVEEILACTQTEKLMKVYNFPTFNTAIEFLMMLTLTTGCLLRISPISFSHLPLSLTDSHSPGRDSRHPQRSTASSRRLGPPQNTLLQRAARHTRRTRPVHHRTCTLRPTAAADCARRVRTRGPVWRRGRGCRGDDGRRGGARTRRTGRRGYGDGRRRCESTTTITRTSTLPNN